MERATKNVLLYCCFFRAVAKQRRARTWQRLALARAGADRPAGDAMFCYQATVCSSGTRYSVISNVVVLETGKVISSSWLSADRILKVYLLEFILFQDKTRFLTYVVAAGLPYGGKEDIFHYFFKVNSLIENQIMITMGDGSTISCWRGSFLGIYCLFIICHAQIDSICTM